MQLSSSVIKNSNVKNCGIETISCKFNYVKKQENKNNDNQIIKDSSEDDNIKRLSSSIIKNAESKSQNILNEALRKAAEIEKKALKDGFENGHEKGYQEGLNKGLKQGNSEAQKIRNDAAELLNNAKFEHEKYLKQKSEDVKELILNILQDILKKEYKNPDCISEMVHDCITQIKKSKTVIVKCNDTYIDDIKSKIEVWKQGIGVMCDIFVLPDKSMKLGKAEINSDDAVIKIDIDECIKKLQDIIKNS